MRKQVINMVEMCNELLEKNKVLGKLVESLEVEKKGAEDDSGDKWEAREDAKDEKSEDKD